MVYHFRVYEEDHGYWAECIELPGCKTEGDSIGDLTQNAEEALNLYLEEPEDSSLSFPLPIETSGPDIIAVPADPQIAFSLCFRNDGCTNPERH